MKQIKKSKIPTPRCFAKNTGILAKTGVAMGIHNPFDIVQKLVLFAKRRDASRLLSNF